MPLLRNVKTDKPKKLNNLFKYLLVSTVVLASCQNAATEKVVHQPASAENTAALPTHSSLNKNAAWPGTYTGTLPCASCSGIETELTLLPNNTYELKQIYLSEKNNEFKNQGSFTWMPDSSGIQLQGLKDMSGKIAIKNKQLLWLNEQGQEVTGSLAKNYILNKVQ